MSDYTADWYGRIIHPRPVRDITVELDKTLVQIAVRVVNAYDADGGLDAADLAYLAPLADKARGLFDEQDKRLGISA